jgi:hypothetical protein
MRNFPIPNPTPGTARPTAGAQTERFYCHLTSFVVVNVGLVAINLLFSRAALWFLWPLLGWGIGLLSHAAGVFRPFRIFPRGWEERKIREYMEKERRP